ncbi:MAG: ABC transporter substrate-binding protein [Cellulosilyticaceae bacterium]
MKAKKLTKILAFSMSMMMMLTGCGSGGSKEATTDAVAETTAEQTAEPKAEETAETEAPAELSKTEQAKAELDFGGETIVFCYPPGYGLINTDGTSLGLARRDAKIEELEKKYNVNIEQRDDASTYWENMVTSIASGAPEGHIMLTQERQLLSWAEAGAVADLSAAMEKTGIDFTDNTKYSQIVRKYSNYNGQQYGFSEPAPYISQAYWFYNKRIFDELQLGDPNEWVEKGEWNWDKVSEVAQKATIRKVDGTIEQYGIGTMMLADFLGSLCQSNGATMAGFDAEGNATLSLADPKAMKAFQQMSDWLFKDKVALFNDGSLDWDATIGDFINGNVAIMCGTNPVLNTAKGAPMADDFGILPPPMGPDVTEYSYGAGMGQFYFIPKTYEDMADKLILLIDDLYELPEGMTREDTVIENYATHVRDEESLQNYVDMALHYNTDIYEIAVVSGLDWSDPSINAICKSVVNGEGTPADLVEQNKVQLQTLLDDKFTKMKFTGGK